MKTLKDSTIARICVGRSGDRYKTDTLLQFRLDHANAIDSLHSSVDESIFDKYNFLKVQTLVNSKEEYLIRPDLARRFSDNTINYIKNNCTKSPDVQILVGDGLSSKAINANFEDTYEPIVDGIKFLGLSCGTPIFIKFARVATMDRISEALNAKVTIILIGERPGLQTAESMSCYMAFEASTQKPESQRTVVSNIYKNGIAPVEAGAQIVSIIVKMLERRKSGVELKL